MYRPGFQKVSRTRRFRRFMTRDKPSSRKTGKFDPQNSISDQNIPGWNRAKFGPEWARDRTGRMTRKLPVPYSMNGGAVQPALSFSINDTALGQIVGRQLHFHPVAWDDADKVLSHFSSDVGQDQRPVVDLDAKSRVCEGLGHRTLDF